MDRFYSPIYIRNTIRIVYVCIFLFVLITACIFVAPTNFPVPHTLIINPGDSTKIIANTLKSEKLIRSKLLFRGILFFSGDAEKLQAGYYSINERLSIFEIISRLKEGDKQLNHIAIMVPEGSTVVQIAKQIESRIPTFNSAKFIAIAQPFEGYLFPDTYLFYPDITPEIALEILSKTFNERMEEFKKEAEETKYSWKDIVIMASILEREARNETDWKIISGILWKRMEIGMPLQVDATFYYERNIPSLSLTTADLRKDSPYNTYTNKGLPPTPIANPGVSTIKASLYPEKTAYFYYLSDSDGKMHYAVTHDEHVKNKFKYLK